MALHAFDVLRKPYDIQKVNDKSRQFDKRLYDQIFVADEVEKSLSAVDTQKQASHT